MPDIDRDQIVFGVNESLNKVAMIASLEILTALDEVQAHYSASTTSLLTKKLEFTIHANQLKNEEDTHANLGQNLIQITAALNAAIQQQDQAKQNEFIAQYKELESLYKQQETDLRSRRANTFTRIQELLGDAIDAALKFDELSAPLNCKVRNELGFPIDKEEYQKMLEIAGTRQRALAAKFKEDWNNKFKEGAENSPFDVVL